MITVISSHGYRSLTPLQFFPRSPHLLLSQILQLAKAELSIYVQTPQYMLRIIQELLKILNSISGRFVYEHTEVGVTCP